MPDAVVIVGPDERQLFTDDNTPAFLVTTLEQTRKTFPRREEAKAKFPPGIRGQIAEIGMSSSGRRRICVCE